MPGLQLIVANRQIQFAIIITVLAMGLSACSSLSDGYANSLAGVKLRKEMCASVRSFVRAPLDDDGLRLARFLPFSSYEDGSIDFYAPMKANPADEYSRAFYNNRVGQLTHYVEMPKFASSVSKCLSAFRGFSQNSFDSTDHNFRASIKDTRLNRRIEVAAKGGTACFLIASDDWNGDVEESLKLGLSSECRN